jgi:hypothetical protein
MKRLKKINLILVLVVVSSLMGIGSIGYAQPKLAPQKFVEKIPSYFVYEGSKVLILYDPSGELIELIYRNQGTHPIFLVNVKEWGQTY